MFLRNNNSQQTDVQQLTVMGSHMFTAIVCVCRSAKDFVVAAINAAFPLAPTAEPFVAT